MKAIVAIVLSMIAFGSTAQAADCNPRAQVHLQRAQNIQRELVYGRIPTSEDVAFMLCMLPEKEDKRAFEQKVNNLKAARAAQQAREEAQRRAAIEAHNRPASPQEQAQALRHCEQTIRGPARDAGMAYCLAAWKANPHSRCAFGNLPCGTEDAGLCYNPYANQRCVNGRTIGVNSSFPPWAEAFLSKGFPLPNGRYVSAASCDGAPPDAVVILQDNTLRAGRTLFNLVNAGGPQSFTAQTTGDGYNGTIGYNWNVTVHNDATSFSLSWVMGNIGRYRLCAPTASARPAETGRQGQQPGPQANTTTPAPADWYEVDAGGCRLFVFKISYLRNPNGKRAWSGACESGYAQGLGIWSTYDPSGRLIAITQTEMTRGRGRTIESYFLGDDGRTEKVNDGRAVLATPSNTADWAREILTSP